MPRKSKTPKQYKLGDKVEVRGVAVCSFTGTDNCDESAKIWKRRAYRTNLVRGIVIGLRQKFNGRIHVPYNIDAQANWIPTSGAWLVEVATGLRDKHILAFPEDVIIVEGMSHDTMD